MNIAEVEAKRVLALKVHRADEDSLRFCFRGVVDRIVSLADTRKVLAVRERGDTGNGQATPGGQG